MAQTTLPVGADCNGIIEAAGGVVGDGSPSVYAAGILTVPDVSQEALDAAVASYDHEAYLLEQDKAKTIKSINEEAAIQIEDFAPLYKQINEISNTITILAEKLELIGDQRLNKGRILRDRINAVRREARAKKEALNARQNSRK